MPVAEIACSHLSLRADLAELGFICPLFPPSATPAISLMLPVRISSTGADEGGYLSASMSDSLADNLSLLDLRGCCRIKSASSNRGAGPNDRSRPASQAQEVVMREARRRRDGDANGRWYSRRGTKATGEVALHWDRKAAGIDPECRKSL